MQTLNHNPQYLTHKTLELLKPKVQIYKILFFKFPVDCDAKMHVLKDSLILKFI